MLRDMLQLMFSLLLCWQIVCRDFSCLFMWASEKLESPQVLRRDERRKENNTGTGFYKDQNSTLLVRVMLLYLTQYSSMCK